MAEDIRPRALMGRVLHEHRAGRRDAIDVPAQVRRCGARPHRTILSTGYNGSIRGMPHCSDVGHMMEDNHLRRDDPTPKQTRSSKPRATGS